MKIRIVMASIAFALLLSQSACSGLEALGIGTGEVLESSEPALSSTSESEGALANSGPAVGQQPSSTAQQAPPAADQAQSAPGGTAASAGAQATMNSGSGDYVFVDTGQNRCFDNDSEIACPQSNEAFYGQDAQYAGVQARYQDNGDGTVTDLNTGLMWQQTPDLNNKVTYNEAVAGAEGFDLAGYHDWRLPTIKELYSLIDFNGSSMHEIPYIDTDYFDFRFGDESQGERSIDAQYWSSTEYVGTVFGGSMAVFGVNFADGRIKGYGLGHPGGREMTQFVRYVRGNANYGINEFVDNGNDTVSDNATGLMWQQSDGSSTMNWESALNYCGNLDYAGYDDWRLPNAKELQSIVDYSRAPDAQNPAQQGAAINPIFDLTETESWFWTSTTHLDHGTPSNAVYIAFGQAFGVPNGTLTNVHGAGAQRSDPKAGNPADYASGRGTEGQDDQVRIYNYARCVRGGAQYIQVTDSGTSESAGQVPAGNQPASGGQPGSLGGQPPAEAINACSGLSENAYCQFTAPHGTVTGSCALISSQLACAPPGGPPAGSP